jgi:outer membrane protein OmpA-like peptidoglycan-associated protein
MTKSPLLLFSIIALPFSAISQVTEPEPAPPAPIVTDPNPVPVPPAPVVEEVVPPAPLPANEPTERAKGKNKNPDGKGNGKGKQKGSDAPKGPDASKAKAKDRPEGRPETRPEPRPTAPTSPRMTTPPAPEQKPAPSQPGVESRPKTPETAAKKENVRPVRPPRPNAQKPPSQETARVLADRGKRDRRVDAQEAAKIEDKDDAKKLIYTILGGAAAGAVAAKIATKERPAGSPAHGYRPPVEEVGRTQVERDRNVGSIVQRFQGNAPAQMPPPGYAPTGVYRTEQGYEIRQDQRAPQFYSGNRRVVRYASVNEIPPVIVASRQLNRVEVAPLARSPYAGGYQGSRDNRYYNEVPASYSGVDAYAVSYEVDPNSAVSRDDILFRQGSTDFADAYSFDLVIDLAEAMNAPSLINENFVIEGHASSEGDYGSNLLLSQERAERIARDLVYYGVSPDRLMPVGYGETEAAYPGDAPEEYRSLDRRVMVFRMR